MAVTNQELFNIFLANPNMSDAQIVSLMETRGISPEQISSTFGIPVGEVVSRVAAVIPEGQSVTLGDTRIAPQYQVTGSGEDRQVGGIENITVQKTTGDVNYKAPVGSEYQNYSPTGEFTGTGKVTSSGDTSFFGGMVDMLKDPVVLAALGGAAYGGLLGGAGTAAAGAEAATAFDLANAGIAGGAAEFTAAELAAIDALSTPYTGSGLLTQAAITNPVFELANAGSGAFTPTTTAGTPTVTTPTVTTPTITTPTVTTPPVTTPPTVTTPPVVAPPTGVPPVVTTPTSIPSVADITKLAQTGLTAAQIAQLFSTGATTAAGLLQSQTSKEAAQKAQAMIDRETAAAKQAAQFTPVGMTTRFGSSQFQVDPVTGKLTSAGYTLSPEAKAAQDRFVKLAEQGIQQAEGAQKAFEPLQTGAASLFSLGNKYLAETPEKVAENYLKSQLALLQPGRELELANLQNKLQQQGRGGLSVAQGGTYGATTPELQALYNARAMQEAQLAAQAQQAGQQQVQFGAGLLGTGAQTMGNYYAGQQAAYAPYTSALGQIQALETAAQQPFTMGAALGQTASTAGFNAGRLGLQGAGQSVALATGDAATNNPYSQLLSGVAANPAFANLASGLFSSQPVTSGFSYGQYGTGVDPSTGEYFGSLYF